MPKYRKKPIAVDAFQMTLGAMNHEVDWPDWLTEAYSQQEEVPGALRPNPVVRDEDRITSYSIFTLEGPHIVIPDAWIVHGVKGEIWAVRDDIFSETYELVSEGDE